MRFMKYLRKIYGIYLWILQETLRSHKIFTQNGLLRQLCGHPRKDGKSENVRCVRNLPALANPFRESTYRKHRIARRFYKNL